MIFWVGILAAAFFAWFAVKTGFYQTWVMLFNAVITVYLSIFLTPVIGSAISAAGDTAYGTALTMVAVAAGAFFILHGLSYSLLTGQFSLSFPRVLDRVASGLLGFVGGLLIWSFLALLVCATPISRSSFVQDIGLERSVRQTNVPYVAWWCDLINAVVATGDNRRAAQEVIRHLLEPAKKDSLHKPTEQGKPASSRQEPSGPAN
jgi:hypothetical protein